jgi:hypothetical protein
MEDTALHDMGEREVRGGSWRMFKIWFRVSKTEGY